MSMSGIASMLGRDGMITGQSLGAPIANFGNQLGGMLAGLPSTVKDSMQRAEAERLIKEYEGDEGKLAEQSRLYGAKGNDALSKLFANAAQQVKTQSTEGQLKQIMAQVPQALQTKDIASLTRLATQLSEINPEAGMKLAQQVQTMSSESTKQGSSRNVQSALGAVRAAAAQGVPLTQLAGLQDYITRNDGTQEQIKEAYQSGLSSEDEGNRYKTVGNNVFDTKTGEYITVDKVNEDLPIGTLKNIATPDSIIEYIKTGDKEKLQPLEQETKDQKESSTAALSKVRKIKEADSVIETVKEASGLAEEIYPMVYDFAKFVPRSDARSLSNKVDTLKANLSFDSLSQMRQESKTGGALGNVTEMELKLLSSEAAALDPASKDFAKQLEKVETLYRDIKNRLIGKRPEGSNYTILQGRIYYQDENGDFYDVGAVDNE